ncbi:MAG: hypothetical protein MI919_13840 [Holophagales bacterium]|nr:hypothetical protein [Holophagales bacterium]
MRNDSRSGEATTTFRARSVAAAFVFLLLGGAGAACPGAGASEALSDWVRSKPHPKEIGSAAKTAVDLAALEAEVKTLIEGGTPGDPPSSGYRLTRLPEESVWIYEDPSHLEPSLIVNTGPRLDLVIQAPHAGLESGTPLQAAYLLRRTGARAVLLSGMHRCASKVFSDCDGKTSVCGEREPYRTSDAAHHVGGAFQKIHEVLAAAWPGSVILQLHEMRPFEKGKLVILSSTARELERDDALVGGLKAAMNRRLEPKIRAVSCHDPKDLELGFRLLCGYTNVQGRQINGSAQPCSETAPLSKERFVHVEQDFHITSDPWYLEQLAASILEAGEGRLVLTRE